MNIIEPIRLAFGVVLEASASAAMLAVVVAIVQWGWHRKLSPAWRFALWVPVLLRLLVPTFPESSFSLFNAPRWLGLSQKAEPALVEPGELTTPVPPIAIRPSTWAVTQIDSIPLIGSAVPRRFDFRAFAAVVWFCGVIIFLGRLSLGAWWLSFRLRRDAQGASGEVSAVMDEARRCLRSELAIRLKETRWVDSPALFGLVRPALLLPVGFAQRLSRTEMRHVFLHELAHLKRRDLYVNWLMALAQAVHWFNPFVWLIFRRMRLERELACDEMALRASTGADPKAYGETILRLLEGTSARPAVSTLVGIAEEKHSARQRLQQIARFQSGRGRYWVALSALVGIIAAGLTNAQGPKNAAPVSTEPAEVSSGLTLAEQLEHIRIEKVSLEGATLTEALQQLQPSLWNVAFGIRFYWHQPTNLVSDGAIYSVNATGFITSEIGTQPTPADEIRLSQKYLVAASRARASLDLSKITNSSVAHLLEIMMRASDMPVTYHIARDRITFFAGPHGLKGREEMPSALIQDGRLLLELGKTEEAKAKFERALAIEPKSRAALYYLSLTERLKAAPSVESQNTGIYHPSPNPSANMNEERRDILRKLKEIRFPVYDAAGVPLADVIKHLHAATQRNDPTGQGVNFLIANHPEERTTNFSEAAVDPLTGQPIPPNPRRVRVADYQVTIRPALRDVRLIDVLDAIVRVAAPPEVANAGGALQYQIEDYGVVLLEKKGDASEPLFTRHYRVDPNTVLTGLDAISDPALSSESPNAMTPIQKKVRNFFIAAGVDFRTNQQTFTSVGGPFPPQKAIFYNDRTGIMMVRVTKGDLELIESALQTMQSDPQVSLMSETIELNDAADLAEVLRIVASIQGEYRPALTEIEFRRLRQEFKEHHPLFEWLRGPNYSTQSGRAARIGRQGYSLDVTCEYLERHMTFRVSARDGSGKGEAFSRQGRIYDGQTFIFLPRVENGEVTPNHITFITARLIDAAGNHIFSDDSVPFDTERVPRQNE